MKCVDEYPERRLPWEACYNVRDLGGYSTKSGKQTRWRAFVRSDNLARLSPDGQKALIAYGVQHIIDLRSAYELGIDPPIFVSQAGAHPYPDYVNLPMLDQGDKAGMEIMNEMTSLAEMYCFIVDRYQENIRKIFKAIAGTTNGTILFHCHSGKDRTGILAAMLLSLAGVDEQTIAQDYAASYLYLQSTYRGTPSNVDHDPERASEPETIIHLLLYLEAQYGGTRSYLLQSGVSEQELRYIEAYLLG